MTHSSHTGQSRLRNWNVVGFTGSKSDSFAGQTDTQHRSIASRAVTPYPPAWRYSNHKRVKSRTIKMTNTLRIEYIADVELFYGSLRQFLCDVAKKWQFEVVEVDSPTVATSSLGQLAGEVVGRRNVLPARQRV